MEKDDIILVEECLQGNVNSFESLIDRYQKPIYNLAYRVVRDKDEAEEITQVTFVKAYENLKGFDKKHKFFSWLYRIAVNETINYTNKRKKFEDLEPDNISQGKRGDELLEEKEISGKIDSALLKLELHYRIVVVLRHFLDLSYQEISELIQVPEKTVKSRLFTARYKLKEVFIKERVIYNEH